MHGFHAQKILTRPLHRLSRGYSLLLPSWWFGPREICKPMSFKATRCWGKCGSNGPPSGSHNPPQPLSCQRALLKYLSIEWTSVPRLQKAHILVGFNLQLLSCTWPELRLASQISLLGRSSSWILSGSTFISIQLHDISMGVAPWMKSGARAALEGQNTSMSVDTALSVDGSSPPAMAPEVGFLRYSFFLPSSLDVLIMDFEASSLCSIHSMLRLLRSSQSLQEPSTSRIFVQLVLWEVFTKLLLRS